MQRAKNAMAGGWSLDGAVQEPLTVGAARTDNVRNQFQKFHQALASLLRTLPACSALPCSAIDVPASELLNRCIWNIKREGKKGSVQ